MSGLIEVSGHRLEQDGPVTTGISLTGNTIIGNTYPRTSLQWLAQHPAIRKRARVVRFAEWRGWRW